MGKSFSDVKILWLSESAYLPQTVVVEHSHAEYYQILYLMDGECTVLIDGEEVHGESGMFFLWAPGVVHGISNVKPGSQGKLIIVGMKFVVFNDELNQELLRLPAANVGTPELKNAYYQILLEAVRKGPYYEQRLPNLLSAWLYQMLSQRQRGGRNTVKGDEQRPTLRVKKYINENFTQELPLDKLAEVSGYSKSYLCQIFREDTGMTINSYINDVRISYAVKLLADTELSVAEVGERCGYNSVFYFIKVFKKVIGIPPGNFRNAEITGAQYVRGNVEAVNTIMKASWVNVKLSPGKAVREMVEDIE